MTTWVISESLNSESLVLFHELFEDFLELLLAHFIRIFHEPKVNNIVDQVILVSLGESQFIKEDLQLIQAQGYSIVGFANLFVN